MNSMSWHEALYGDPKRVAQARIQAKGRIAKRRLWQFLVVSWAEPVVAWVARNL